MDQFSVNVVLLKAVQCFEILLYCIVLKVLLKNVSLELTHLLLGEVWWYLGLYLFAARVARNLENLKWLLPPCGRAETMQLQQLSPEQKARHTKA